VLPFSPPPSRWIIDWRTDLCFTALYSRSCYGAGIPVTTRRRRLRIGPSGTANTSSPGTYECPKCRKIYKWYRGLHRHLEYECGKAPRFRCPHCVYTGKHRSHVYSHIKSNHHDRPVYAVDTKQTWRVSIVFSRKRIGAFLSRFPRSMGYR